MAAKILSSIGSAIVRGAPRLGRSVVKNAKNFGRLTSKGLQNARRFGRNAIKTRNAVVGTLNKTIPGRTALKAAAVIIPTAGSAIATGVIVPKIKELVNKVAGSGRNFEHVLRREYRLGKFKTRHNVLKTLRRGGLIGTFFDLRSVRRGGATEDVTDNAEVVTEEPEKFNLGKFAYDNSIRDAVESTAPFALLQNTGNMAQILQGLQTAGQGIFDGIRKIFGGTRDYAYRRGGYAYRRGGGTKAFRLAKKMGMFPTMEESEAKNYAMISTKFGGAKVQNIDKGWDIAELDFDREVIGDRLKGASYLPNIRDPQKFSQIKDILLHLFEELGMTFKKLKNPGVVYLSKALDHASDSESHWTVEEWEPAFKSMKFFSVPVIMTIIRRWFIRANDNQNPMPWNSWQEAVTALKRIVARFLWHNTYNMSFKGRRGKGGLTDEDDYEILGGRRKRRRGFRRRYRRRRRAFRKRRKGRKRRFRRRRRMRYGKTRRGRRIGRRRGRKRMFRRRMKKRSRRGRRRRRLRRGRGRSGGGPYIFSSTDVNPIHTSYQDNSIIPVTESSIQVGQPPPQKKRTTLQGIKRFFANLLNKGLDRGGEAAGNILSKVIDKGENKLLEKIKSY